MDIILQFVVTVNFALLLAVSIVFCSEFLIKLSKWRYAYRLRLNLAIAAFFTAIIPVFLMPWIEYYGLFADVNATDFIVSQYLKGNVALSATQISSLLSIKEYWFDFVVDLFITTNLIIYIFFVAVIFRILYILRNIFALLFIILNGSVIKESKRVRILISDHIAVPFSTRGFLKYYILLPSSFLTDDDMKRIAIGHEAQHIRQNDVDWEIILTIVSPLFVLNPAFWLLLNQIRRFREYCCDAAFLQRSSFDPKAYCYGLINIAASLSKTTRQSHHLSTMTVPLLGGESLFHNLHKSELKRRIIAISEISYHNKWFNRIRDTMPALSLILLVSLGYIIFSKPTDWSQDRLMLSTVVNLERLDRINGFGLPQGR